ALTVRHDPVVPLSSESSPSKPGSVLKRALLNQYNYIMLGSSALLSFAMGSWLPALVGVGAEILWVVLGADSEPFRRWVAMQESKEAKQRMLAEVAQLASTLEPEYGVRFEALRSLADEIQSLARENKGFETSLLQTEMAKLGQLLHSFLKMAGNHQRLQRYLASNPVAEVERDIARSQRAMKQETDPRVQASLRQALELAQKRLKQHLQIEGAWKALSVQMDTLEKAFDYLKSHILGIGSGAELAEELDNLVSGVSTVTELEASTSELMDELRGQAARADKAGKVISMKG
ncbi:MAG TPA: hypothetical protein VN914_07550, partial [Polyangia bacterium]|nr:hypothetical protein [Polyangia bacterium]